MELLKTRSVRKIMQMMIYIQHMEDVNSNNLFDPGHSFAAYGSRQGFNQSILSSKPPLLETIRNNFGKILSLNSAGIHGQEAKSNTPSKKLTNLNIKPVAEPKSSEVKLDRVCKPPSALQKPPIVPKFATYNKGKNTLEPPSSILASTLKPQLNNLQFGINQNASKEPGSQEYLKKSTKVLKKVNSISKSAGLKGLALAHISNSGLDKSLNLKCKLKNSGGTFSASLASSKLHNYKDGHSTLPRIIESSHEINESGERRTIILNTFSEDGSEGDGTNRWSNQHKMERVEEVIEDLQDFFQV